MGQFIDRTEQRVSTINHPNTPSNRCRCPDAAQRWPTTHLVSRTAESLHDDGLVGVLASDGEDDLANVDTGDHAVGLSPGASHSGLETIRAGARQHLVDTDDVVRVDADAHVERVLARGLGHVFVGADTGGLERLGRELLVLVRDEVAAERELIDRRTFASEVENPDLGVWNAAIVS